ncbi:MAG: hypothetical protein ACK58N_01500 [Synechocystis sp.]
MVIWVYAGGGETEISGLIKFLQSNFPQIAFERQLPYGKKPGPKPRKLNPNKPKTLGITNRELRTKIKECLPLAIQDSKRTDKCMPSLILVIDDLDCRNLETQRGRFNHCLEQIPEASSIRRYVLFASPEIETWIVADWENTFAKHRDFKIRKRHQAMQHWLSSKHNFPFNQPEIFGKYDEKRDCCDKKLSELLIQVSINCSQEGEKEYKKSVHSAELLLSVNIFNILAKCPIVKEFYYFITNFDS